jgi:drug/metabolite transporter (DMT)-like permease
MILSAGLLGILFALTSAGVWGMGDFTGGYATRRTSQYVVLALSALSGLVVLGIATLISGETFPGLRGVGFSLLAGLSGALGIGTFYRALSMGHNASVAPTTAVVGAALPVLFATFTHGFPGPLRLMGFGLALAGIWLVSASAGETGPMPRRLLLLAYLSGVGFGGFFIALGLVEQGKIFTPLILSRSLTLLVGLLFIKYHRLALPALRTQPLALLAGVLDAGGNLFYVLAKQYTRLDVAAVLASLYPISTVLLAAIVLKERITPRQGLGVLVCLAAIVLITL